MADLGVNLDKPYAQQPETRAAAVRFLERSGNTDVAEALGLVEDPIAAARSRAKAAAELHGKGVNGVCPICGNGLPSHGVCRRREGCREAARARGLQA